MVIDIVLIIGSVPCYYLLDNETNMYTIRWLSRLLIHKVILWLSKW